MLKFIEEFEKGASLKETVADLILNMSEHFKELGIVDLGVAKDVT